jgi:hypothetical protein
MIDLRLYVSNIEGQKYQWAAPEIRGFIIGESPYKSLRMWGPPWGNWDPGPPQPPPE